MKSKKIQSVVSFLLLVFVALFVAAVRAQERERSSTDDPKGEVYNEFEMVGRLPTGIYVGFSSRSVNASGARRLFGSHMGTSSDGIFHRIFLDKESDFYFGYDLQVEALAATGQIRVS